MVAGPRNHLDLQRLLLREEGTGLGDRQDPCLAALGDGCSSAQVTQPLPISADTYTVSARTPHVRAASARDAALSAANPQCARLSKQLLVLKSSNSFELNENKDIETDTIEVTFRSSPTAIARVV